ncbi:MAG: insulinase family protein [Zoogloeaceae bacterium]|jgi:zinc protease|nr:insulinase family protein [Zoogloeaceae bacterium]
MKPLAHWLSAIILATLAPCAAFANSAETTFETTLANGLKVVVREDHRAPVAAQMVWYRVGSMDEVDGASGLAHMLEHMMFKGTPKVPAGEFSRRVAAAGGRDNAFTNRDYTAYFQQVPKEKLGEMMALEADRMRYLSVDEKEFAPELKVVMEERRLRTEDNPHALLFEQANAVAFQSHPYRRPVIGWMNDLEHMTAADAKTWHNTWYAPNNAILVVSGDVEHEAVFRLAQQHYGPARARVLPPRRPQTEPAQKGLRRLWVKGPAELPYLLMGWKAPRAETLDGSIEPFALEMLAAILDGHAAARLPRRLVREARIANDVGASYDAASRGPAMFYLYGVSAPGQPPEILEAALREEITRIARDGVDAAELARAKAQLIAGETYKRDSVFGQAMELGMMGILGFTPRDIDRWLVRLESVTAAEVQAVAQRWFVDDSLTIGVLQPESLAAEKAAPH